MLLTHNYTYAQDTFSIVAVDKETGEIGAAGATCIKGIEQGIIKVISSIVPGKGGIISQAYVCIPNKNLQNATKKMKEGMLSLYFFEFDNSNNKIINEKLIPIKSRVRDIKYLSQYNSVVMFLETNSTLGILKQKN